MTILDVVGASLSGDQVDSLGLDGGLIGLEVTDSRRGYGFRFAFGSNLLFGSVTDPELVDAEERFMVHSDLFLEPRYYFGEPLQRLVPYAGARVGLGSGFSGLDEFDEMDLYLGATYGVNGGLLVFLNPRFSVDVSAAAMQRKMSWNLEETVDARLLQLGIGLSYGW